MAKALTTAMAAEAPPATVPVAAPRRGMFALAALVSGLALAAPYLVPWTWPLSFVALVPFFWIVEHSPTWKTAFWSGWLVSLVTMVVLFYWLNYTIVVYGGSVGGFCIPIFLVYTALFGTRFPLLALVLHWLRHDTRRLLIWPAAVVASEMTQLSLFPWYFASAHVKNLWFMQASDLIGVAGLSFFLAMTAVVTYRRFPRRETLITAGTLLLVYAYGAVRMHQVETITAAAPAKRIAVIQPDTPLRMESLDEGWQAVTTCQMLTQQAIQQGPLDLIVWPEGGVPFSFKRDVPFANIVSSLARQAHADLLINDHLYEGDQAFNNETLINVNGGYTDNYKKMKLLAFGEYLPFSDWFPQLRKVADISNFTPGHEIKVLHADCGIIAPQVCYEIIFPGLTRQFVVQNADFIINATDDAWFGPFTGSWCHLLDGLPRAIENRVPLVRDTNSGISTVVDAVGHYRPGTPLFQKAWFIAEIHPAPIYSFYTHYGDVFGWLCTALTLLTLGISKWRGPYPIP